MTAFNLIAAALLAAQPAPSGADCRMTAAETAWVDRSLSAWERVRSDKLKIAADAVVTLILFNDRCRFETKRVDPTEWRAAAHGGAIRLPDGTSVEVGLASGAGRDPKSGTRYFVMALPAIWFSSGAFQPGEEDVLSGVFLHEFSHVAHTRVLGLVFEAAKAGFAEPADLTDDSIQKHFLSDPAYVAVAERERELLYDAANEADPTKAKALAREALALIEARRKRWFVGEDAVWAGYDDLFLTMEGVGQWAAYAWLADPSGGAMTAEAAQAKMRGSRRWWSQDNGLSAFLIIDRFVPGWQARAFAAEPALATDLLRMAVAEDSRPLTKP